MSKLYFIQIICLFLFVDFNSLYFYFAFLFLKLFFCLFVELFKPNEIDDCLEHLATSLLYGYYFHPFNTEFEGSVSTTVFLDYLENILTISVEKLDVCLI